MKKIALRIWNGWKKIALKIARFQTALLLTLFYFLMLAPLGSLFRLFRWDPLQTGRRHHRKDSNWSRVVDGEPDLPSLRRQS
jgi:hypothetical protein